MSSHNAKRIGPVVTDSRQVGTRTDVNIAMKKKIPVALMLTDREHSCPRKVYNVSCDKRFIVILAIRFEYYSCEQKCI
jgi:hypothetical protein